ncbi:hypothetical protein BS47DRAFT_1400877 [Hydnum rufescens UP504]|uniref:Uncharacterized protein n=1 Tax=Hydnum rufescens UP504 TaxID=1448309 RepID=A0A9P6DK55_9AGAM|nr:hypothetical protein BS47DRAFT_1400877 [Hydnum rufescens UP504]
MNGNDVTMMNENAVTGNDVIGMSKNGKTGNDVIRMSKNGETGNNMIGMSEIDVSESMSSDRQGSMAVTRWHKDRSGSLLLIILSLGLVGPPASAYGRQPPMEPCSGHLTIASSAPPIPPATPLVASVIAPCLNAVPLKSWHCIDISPISEFDRDVEWVLWLRQWEVLTAHKSKPTWHKGALYHIFLMFKAEGRRNACVEDYIWEKPLQNFVGVVDIFYIDRVYAHASSEEEVSQLLAIGPPTLNRESSLGQIILDYEWYPPIPVDKNALVPRKMDVADISASWYSARLTAAPAGSVTCWMRHLEMMILAHTDGMAIGNPVKSHFQEPIWQTTSGTMVADLRRITKWKQADIRKEGSQLKTQDASEETFGRMKGNAIWRVILDLTLEQPWYPS